MKHKGLLPTYLLSLYSGNAFRFFILNINSWAQLKIEIDLPYGCAQAYAATTSLTILSQDPHAHIY